MYSVYRLVSPTGKIYVGETGRPIKDRWNSGYSSIRGLSQDIDAVGGLDGFEKEVLVSNIPNHDIALLLEREYILMYREMGHEVYNKKINKKVVERLGLAPQKEHSEIVCIETEERFPSLRAAAEHFGCSYELIRLSIKNGRSAKKFHFTRESVKN